MVFRPYFTFLLTRKLIKCQDVRFTAKHLAIQCACKTLFIVEALKFRGESELCLQTYVFVLGLFAAEHIPIQYACKSVFTTKALSCRS